MPSELQKIPSQPEILTTTVGSYSPIDWLAALPSEQAVLDATAVVIHTQQSCGIDLPTDGELYRFDVNHPDTNGMIEYFISRIGGIDTQVGISDSKAFRKKKEMGFRRKPAGVVRGPLNEGSLDLEEACARSASVANGPLKFTLTSPYMLARTLLDTHYGSLEDLTLAIADTLAEQVSELPCACVQVDEANIPGSPENAPLAQEAINRILRKVNAERAVHFCFGNYGGQSIQAGGWKALTDFLNGLETDHLVLELAHRPKSDLLALKEIDPKIKLGLGVIDIKVNHVETADQVAARIEEAAKVVGADRIGWVHPDCGFWMLKRSIADRKLEALVQGRDKFLGR
ncbi:cobalamin-independent methionine synthase II family protein [Pelagicoccus sp. NFK12]|uniref:Cobalamin-independent methionine synthase II family protein n=1 Tax=Pelagicoccus enzymogenes TaxID=2773457 RepID=A0A927F576_9BACT|nr:cobalamin-independent methionine synthase II family protein [Pelagicoccus enzymogenes]MBD5777881.1 cobalamin-independent methionine synthase II family protein [Pelagicoccus enzymogenes]MDQ8200827.1 cobalamin-independent methionine synthase II family protein [Pelagicoccus enzymogenes]